MKVKRIILEEINDFLSTEGVADKYAQRAFNIPDPNVEMDKIAMSGIKPDNSMGEYVGDATSAYSEKDILSKIYLNPTSLENFDEDVRAISDLDGNLFVGQLDKDYYHNRIAAGVTKGGKFEIPDAYDTKKIIQWHRIGKTNNFGYSVSYSGYFRRNKLQGLLAIKAVQDRHPQFKFHPAYWSDIHAGNYDMTKTDLDAQIVDEKKMSAMKNEIETNVRYQALRGINDVDELKNQIVTFQNNIKWMKNLPDDKKSYYANDIRRYEQYINLGNEILKKYSEQPTGGDEQKNINDEIQTNPEYEILRAFDIHDVSEIKDKIRFVERTANYIRNIQNPRQKEIAKNTLIDYHKTLEALKKLQQQYSSVDEGLADRFAEKVFGIKNQEKELERKAIMNIDDQDSDMGEYMGDVLDVDDEETLSKVYMNPENLSEFEADVRAFSDENGNLFVAQFLGQFTHRKIGFAVKELGKYDVGNVDNAHKYIQWERIGETDDFGFSVTYWQHLEFAVEHKPEYIEPAKKLVAAVQNVNPQFRFIPMYTHYIKKGYYDIETQELNKPEEE